MTIKDLTLILITLLTACRDNSRLPDSLKKGLLDFSLSESSVTRQLSDTANNKTLDLGALWTGLNKINARTSHDTLIVDVNIELPRTANYDGGIEFVNDTLFLYAKRLDQIDIKETVHSTLTYKISTNGQLYKEIEFKELK